MDHAETQRRLWLLRPSSPASWHFASLTHVDQRARRTLLSCPVHECSEYDYESCEGRRERREGGRTGCELDVWAGWRLLLGAGRRGPY